MLMDEPFGAVDPIARERLQNELLRLQERLSKTILFVTHDIDEAIFMANRVVVMSARPGRIKCDLPVPIEHPRHYSVKTTPAFTGLKATQTRVSRAGVMPLSFSADNVGPLVRTARDAARFLKITAGHDPKDPTSAPEPGGPLALEDLRVNNMVLSPSDSGGDVVALHVLGEPVAAAAVGEAAAHGPPGEIDEQRLAGDGATL